MDFLVPRLGAFRVQLGASEQVRRHRRMRVAGCGSSCAHGRERTAVSQSTQRDTVASSICVSICVVTRVVLVHRLLESAR